MAVHACSPTHETIKERPGARGDSAGIFENIEYRRVGSKPEDLLSQVAFLSPAVLGHGQGKVEESGVVVEGEGFGDVVPVWIFWVLVAYVHWV